MQNYLQKVKSIILINEYVPDCEFNELALELFNHHIDNNQVYKKICNSRDLQPPSHWSDIPLITTDSFKKFSFFCGQDSELVKTFYSSGTSTGNRSKHYLSKRELELYELSLWASFSKAFDLTPSAFHKREESNIENFHKDKYLLLAEQTEQKSPLTSEERKEKQSDARGKVFKQTKSPIHYLVLTESPKEKPNSSLIHMFEVIRQNLEITEDCFYYKDERLQTERLITKLKELENTKNRILIVGTAFSFVHFLDNCKENLNLTSNTMLMETGGYKGKSREVPKEELYNQLSAKLNINQSQIIGQYGMSELCTQFYDRASPPTPLQVGEGREHLKDAEGVRPTPRGKNIPPWSRIRILNPNNLKEEVKVGEQGLIAIYDLCNIDSCPFILTGDIGIKREKDLELIGRSSKITQKGCSLNYG